MTWAASVEIYERLSLTMNRNWKSTQVVEGAPTASNWIGLKLQTAIDTNDIKGTKDTKKAVIRQTRMCIDAGQEPCNAGCAHQKAVPHTRKHIQPPKVAAISIFLCVAVRVLGKLMSQQRPDAPDAEVAGPASMLATALNVSMEENDMLADHVTKFSLARCSMEKTSDKANMWPLSQVIFMSVLSWYSEAVGCLLEFQKEPRYLLAYVALPEAEQIVSYLSFVEQYNGMVLQVNSETSSPKTTVDKGARKCQLISLATGEQLERYPCIPPPI